MSTSSAHSARKSVIGQCLQNAKDIFVSCVVDPVCVVGISEMTERLLLHARERRRRVRQRGIDIDGFDVTPVATERRAFRPGVVPLEFEVGLAF